MKARGTLDRTPDARGLHDPDAGVQGDRALGSIGSQAAAAAAIASSAKVRRPRRRYDSRARLRRYWRRLSR